MVAFVRPDLCCMAFYHLGGSSEEHYLSAARAASWMNNTFDSRTVAKWCDLTEKEGLLIHDKLVGMGRVKVLGRGISRLIDG